MHNHRVMSRQFFQQINVACDQIILGDDADRVAEFGQHRETLAGQLQPALNRFDSSRSRRSWQQLGFPFGR